MILLMTVLAVRFLIWVIPVAEAYAQQLYRRIRQKMAGKKLPGFFETNYIECKAFYVREYNTTPCISFINNLDVAKAYAYINNGFAGKVLAIYQRNYYSWQHEQQEFSCTIFKLEGSVLIELGNEYAEILFDNNSYPYANNLIKVFCTYKAPEKEADFEINIITHTSNGLDLKQLEIKPTTLDIGLYYNDDFEPVNAIIKERLAKECDKGIILLHGLPGTGKTTYLRHLIGGLKKKVLFVAPGVAGNLMDPEFIDLLIDNPNAVLVIEDAENIIMDRRFNNNSSVSNLLNISDGLLSDCLNVQIICTFNSAISTVDSALLRKGRLIAKYEFGKLSVEKSRKLSNHLGFDKIIDKPMTIAEIANPDDMEVAVPAIQVMGFRREALMN
ncbi:AAA family ATPase [Ferruginibacter paludis]|uniref:AAA family ATPase n=1 Tax=Ferruginibacter paludis TaxID=1310417 RepID=UPI0025B36307|nr:AAA family ATPase [Ferruginibacter paludis]MDN3658375.1 AAA family ATPase [Ferruginibacter paludis]